MDTYECCLFAIGSGDSSRRAWQLFRAIYLQYPFIDFTNSFRKEYNARMLWRDGVSEFVEIEHLSSRDIALKVDKLLSYDYYQENLRYYNEVIRNREYDGAKQAIKIINKYL